jgi:YHS domain-containing protein
MKSPNLHKWILLSFFCAVVLLIGFGGSAAGASPAETVAIKGYDSVAYFTDGKALQGSASFSFRWHGMMWYFRTAGNRDLFAPSPEKYAPQYDGYCAWAMTESRKAITDPEVWRIVDGKLYLNCSRSAYQKWIKDLPGNIKKADQNWLKLQGESPKEK